MTNRPPENPAKLDAMMADIDRVFRTYVADTQDIIDVTSKLSGYALAATPAPDPELAFTEFMRMVRDYRDRYDLAFSAAAGRA